MECSLRGCTRLLVLGPFGAVGVALLGPPLCRADAPQVHLGGFEEGHHEGLLVLRPVATDQARHAGIDDLSCRGRRRGKFNRNHTFFLIPSPTSENAKDETVSCRPRFLPGFRTQWLLVAVTSNTNQPSSAAQITRESSRTRSDSLEDTEEEFAVKVGDEQKVNGDYVHGYKR
ncbi:hypothetical protein EYF80_044491 [Liparis tanakae]|uniref:Uncharacterized protein n=1 Tax=Liparis tanakae TaxID=230148 RepID=A0A4Z2FVQ5_9TELE|nr:hypothetical protein EYF80_044491 [Liparis tanakae]